MAFSREGAGIEYGSAASGPERCGRSLTTAALVSARASGGDEPPSDRAGRRRESPARGARHLAAARGGGLAAAGAGRAPARARRRPARARPERPLAHRLRSRRAHARRLTRRLARPQQRERRGGRGRGDYF